MSDTEIKFTGKDNHTYFLKLSDYKFAIEFVQAARRGFKSVEIQGKAAYDASGYYLGIWTQ